MHEPSGATESALREFGRRNLVYLLFALLLGGVALALYHGERIQERRIALGLLALWLALSAVFLFANLVMAVSAMRQGRRDVPALVASLLPPLLALLGWLALSNAGQ